MAMFHSKLLNYQKASDPFKALQWIGGKNDRNTPCYFETKNIVFLGLSQKIFQGFSRILSGWWFGTFFIFPYIGFLIIPIDFHIFQRGGLTTNQINTEILRILLD